MQYFVKALDVLHGMAEGACHEQQRHQQQQRLHRQVEPAGKSESPDRGNQARYGRRHNARYVAHVEKQGREKRQQGNRENPDHLRLVLIHPADQRRLTRQIDVVVGVGCGMCQAIEIVEGFSEVQAVFDEGGLNQGGGGIFRHQEPPRIRGSVHALLEFLHFGRRLGHRTVHQRTHIDAKGCGRRVARLGGRYGQDLVMVYRGRQVDVPGQIPHFLKRVRIVDVATRALDHHEHGQGIAEIRMIAEGFRVGVSRGLQIREYRLDLHPWQPGRRQQSSSRYYQQRKRAMSK